MIDLCFEYLFLPSIRLYVIIISQTHFTVNPHSIFPLISRNSFVETGAIPVKLLQRDPNQQLLIPKRTLNNLAKLITRLSFIVSTFLYGPFDCMLVSSNVGISEWFHTLYFPECQELLARNRRDISTLTYFNRSRIHNHLVRKRTLNYYAKLAKWVSFVVSTYPYVAFDCILISCHLRISEWIHTLYLLEFQELLAWNRRDIWSLSECNGTQTHKHLVRNQTLNHLAKLTKSLSCVLSTYLYLAFDCMLVSSKVRNSEWIHTLYLPEC